MSQLYRIVEKGTSSGRPTFTKVGGVWHPDLRVVQRNASELAQTTLAHRLFIVSSERGVVEEIELAPLSERMAQIHRICLASKSPERLEDEDRRISSLPGWQQRLPLCRGRTLRVHAFTADRPRQLLA